MNVTITSWRGRWRTRLVAAAIGLGLAVAAAAQTNPAQSTDCPPALQPPTPAQLQAALRAAGNPGALWRLTRDGASSFLFATLHVGKLEWAVPGPRLRAALAASETIALELDPTDPQVVARLNAAPPAGTPSALTPALAARLARRVEQGCVPPELRALVEAQHPVLKAVTLTLLDARRAGLEAAYGQELMLVGYAHAAQRRIVSLETPEAQLAALIPASTAELQASITGMLDQLDQGTARRTVDRLAAAWARGDLDELGRYEQWCDCVLDEADRALMRRLLDARNPGLADGIDALHRQGRGKVFAAVGALHMVGPQGLPALLKARGYTVERLVD